MKVGLLSIISVIPLVSANACVYDLNSNGNKQLIINDNELLLYLSDKYNIGDYYEVGQDASDNLLQLFEQEVSDDSNKKPEVLIMVNGVESPADFFDSDNLLPTFEVDDSHKGFRSTINELFNKFPLQIGNSDQQTFNKLTNEMKFLSTGSEKKLISHFKLFSEQLTSLWERAKENFISANPETSMGVGIINDKTFINEIAQLNHLNDVELASNDKIFINLNSLTTIGKKIGFNSRTYKLSSDILSRYLVNLQSKFNVNIITIPVELTSKPVEDDQTPLVKRQDLFKRESDNCFSTEQSCQVSTSNCNGHGVCSQSADCWACICSPTFDETAQKTTHWAGYACSKKDVSVEANLFLWTGVSLLALIVAGIKLLASIGNESLPGVLDAATVLKKTA